MTEFDPKAEIRTYLQHGRDAIVWKLDGLSEYDIRRPIVPTGTNLLGLVKHLTGVELGYFGDVFGRASPDQLVWEDTTPNADMFATADESRSFVTERYRRAWVHADATIDALALEDLGHVPWWPADRNTPTLHRLLVHVAMETHRHAGHADILRELIDGQAGVRRDLSNLPDVDQVWWQGHYNRVELVAQQASQQGGRAAVHDDA